MDVIHTYKKHLNNRTDPYQVNYFTPDYKLPISSSKKPCIFIQLFWLTKSNLQTELCTILAYKLNLYQKIRIKFQKEAIIEIDTALA